MDETVRIPGYVVEGRIGSGAMATVYLALQQALDRRVALKLMAASLAADQTFRERFLKEGRIVAQLNHPSIVTIYDIGQAGSNYFMAMEYLAGGTLKDRLRDGLPVTETVSIVRQIAQALGYAHHRQFVHRDVKPANILFREDGTPVLTDFGIAKVLGDATQVTQAGWAIGTPSYMSPEQALGKPIDARSDLYSLGVVFYEMLSGSKPYRADDSFAIALMHVNEPIPRLAPDLSRFQAIVDRLLAKTPDDRFASAAELCAALDRVPPAAQPAALDTATAPTRIMQAPKPSRRHWPLAVVMVMLAALGVGGYMVKTGLLWHSVVTSDADIFGITSHARAPLTAAQKTTVSQLLEVAALNLETGRLVNPPISNAAHGFRQVLEIDPDNAKARAGLQQIADTFLHKASKAQTDDKPPAEVRKYVEAGLVAAPNYPALLKLKYQLDQRLTRN